MRGSTLVAAAVTVALLGPAPTAGAADRGKKAAADRAATTLGLPSSRGCLAGRRIALTLRAPRGTRSAVVLVNGKPVRRLRGKALRRTFTLRGLKSLAGSRSGRVRVTVVANRRGRPVTATRTYRLCAGELAKLRRPGARPGAAGSVTGAAAAEASSATTADSTGGTAQGGAGTGPARSGAIMPGCADDSRFTDGVHPGGEWRRNGQDFDNTRTQETERTIDPGNVDELGEAWRFSSKAAGGAGDFTGTPIVADGCVYAASNAGWVFALNADTGALVWKARLPRGGQVAQSVTVGDGKVLAGITGPPPTGSGERVQPYMAAFDQATGALAWASAGLEDALGTDILGAPLLFDASDNGVDDPVVFTGISGWGAEADFDPAGPLRYRTDGSFVLLDARTGEVLKQTYVVGKEDPEDEHAGCGIWSSPAIDQETDRGYVGVSNPHKPEAEHPNCNAVIEFVADRTDPRFGTITKSFKGTPESYVQDFFSEYPCISSGLPKATPSQELGTCPDMDLAVGAPPNLIDGPDGRKMVGVGQKSGHYHLWDIATGERVWRTVIGLPTLIGGIVGGTAYDGERIYGPSTVPGYVFSLEKGNGLPQWVAPHHPVSYGNPTSTANGVVYTTSARNMLKAFDAESGQELFSATLPPGEQTQGTVGGVAIARNTVYAAVGTQALEEGFIVAFRPGATGGGGGGGGGEPEPAPSPFGSGIVAGPGATSTGFVPAVSAKGAPLTFLNLDTVVHDVRSVDAGPDGKPLFSSPRAGAAGQTRVEGAEKLPGGTYDFLCTLHPGMNGTLTVAG